MKTLFQIEATDNQGDVLLCEWGQHYCCFCGYDNTSNRFVNLQYFAFEYLDAGVVKDVIEKIKKTHSYKKIIISSAFPKAISIPLKLKNAPQAFSSVVFEVDNDKQLYDQINEWQVLVDYKVPNVLYEQLTEAFPSAEFIHTYTSAIKSNYVTEASEVVVVDFSPKEVKVVVKKEGVIQLAQTYFYVAPMDVVYYLLKIFEQLHLSQEKADVFVSGLIEEDSGLYKELNNYFKNLQFSPATNINIESGELPKHFFSSIYNLAACVS